MECNGCQRRTFSVLGKTFDRLDLLKGHTFWEIQKMHASKSPKKSQIFRKTTLRWTVGPRLDEKKRRHHSTCQQRHGSILTPQMPCKIGGEIPGLWKNMGKITKNFVGTSNGSGFRRNLMFRPFWGWVFPYP